MIITIFENEYDSVKGAFEVANLVEFNSSLELKVFASSQSADSKEVAKSDVIFVDIDLSQKSELDGFGLIQALLDFNNTLIKKIVILTGNNKITETLRERNIKATTLKVIMKPTDYMEISEVIKKVTIGFKGT